jgi:thiamine pyrophosphate-dependent acetolactate synthase large subunit-like protein
MGVPARQVTTADALTAAVVEALATPGPFLIDVLIAGK